MCCIFIKALDFAEADIFNIMQLLKNFNGSKLH